MRLHRIAIIIDNVGQVAGAVLSTDYDTRAARHRPVDVGPFDTPAEAFAAVLDLVDVQLSLWDAAG